MAKAGFAPEDRGAVLEAARQRKMARSAHAYVRGATARFYEWLAELPEGEALHGPPVWICGDCHLGNLGPLADAAGGVEVQIRDLDQTVVGDPADDLIRLGLSLASAVRGFDLPGVTTALMIEEMVRGYGEALDADDDPSAPLDIPEPEIVRALRRRALGRRWRHLARERIDGPKPEIPLGKRFWPLASEERHALTALFASPSVHALVLSLDTRDGDQPVELLDAAYWMKGCSSLGLLRYAALVAIGEKGKRRDLALIDLKEAPPILPPVAPPEATALRMPHHLGERVVAGARALSPALGERMIAADLLRRPMVLRELAPQDLKLEVGRLSGEEAARVARYLAYVVGRAHARQMDLADRKAWRGDLARHAPGLDAPNWLWTAVVALMARHEAGYLEHCRRYALAQAPKPDRG